MKNVFRISGLILLIFIIHSCKKDKPSLPDLTTMAITGVSYTSAISGGEVTDEGSAPVVSKGVCWNTTADPTIANNKTIEIGGPGVFTSNITLLTSNTMYYVRAYATSSIGTGYGNQITFTTGQIKVPVLKTSIIAPIAQTTAISGGEITFDNGGFVTERGVCWSTATLPTTAHSKTTDGTGTGVFTSSISGLVSGTKYYLRAYATNIAGTGYGSELSFTTTSVNGEVFLAEGFSPAWSPDGSKITFLRLTGMYIMNSDGTNQQELATGYISLNSWSPSGSYIVFLGSRNLYRINSNGSSQINLTNNSVYPYVPSWSPDEKRIAFIGSSLTGNLYMMNNDGTNIHIVTALPSEVSPYQIPDWSSDGNRILFSSGYDKSRDFYIVDSNGSNLFRLAIDSLYEEDGQFSYDGTKIFFAGSSGKWNIYRINSDGSGIVNLTGNKGTNHYPQLSPDGLKIAFNSYRDLEDALYIMAADGSNQQRISGPGVSSRIEWSPDGQKVAFSASRPRLGDNYSLGIYSISVPK